MFKFLMLAVMAVVVFCCSFIEMGLAQEAVSAIPDPPQDLPWMLKLLVPVLGRYPDINGWVIVVFGGLLVLFRSAAEVIGAIAIKTESTKDDGWAATLSKLAVWAASILGWLGAGTPTSIRILKEKKG